MSTSHAIIICPTCKGKGHVEKNEITDYHHRERSYWDETCNVCNGSGRVVEKTETHITPFKPTEPRKKGKK